MKYGLGRTTNKRAHTHAHAQTYTPKRDDDDDDNSEKRAAHNYAALYLCGADVSTCGAVLMRMLIRACRIQIVAKLLACACARSDGNDAGLAGPN